jgi:hypothetical protein
MAWAFGDSFDTYAVVADMNGYWDTVVVGNSSLITGRFANSMGWSQANGLASLAKASGVNDNIHHIVCSVNQVANLTGTTLGHHFTLMDGSVNQCSIVFRSDGAILLTSGLPSGTVLATFNGGLSISNVWTAYEFEVVIHPSAGSFKVRKNGNTVDDFSITGLNTRPGANTYANKIFIGLWGSISGGVGIDDFFWRSDTSSVPWMGDMRCYVRSPVSDASIQFAKSTTGLLTQAYPPNSSSSGNANYITSSPVTALANGTLGALSFMLSTGVTGNFRMALYDSTAPNGRAGNLIATATSAQTNPAAGLLTFPVTAGPTITRGTVYWVAVHSDVNYTPGSVGGGWPIISQVQPYASGFVSNLSGGVYGASTGMCSVGIVMASSNYSLVSELRSDGAAAYVYDSAVGHADFYGIAPIPAPPLTTVAVVTRSLMAKSDAGTRTAAMQIKSGATTVASPTLSLTPTYTAAWRVDTVDPATGAAWTAAAVAAAQIGPVVVS